MSEQTEGVRLKRYYVTVTWDNWPEGGSYGDIVEAESPAEAEAIIMQAMADSKACEGSDESPEAIMASYASKWHVVDCFDVDAFISSNAKPSSQKA